ncbi:MULTISPECIES: aminotransferase class I/II-fold pyridoxal phosphate-dependent enzyme [unclassified Rhodococcus (in: high G+C Gram-positive bacteria)]|uniref:aminotransferase class I/II-fold pyridoxal phosphate-dependent enzyme n=1 Tax=unclassified Rhodococcus (in: high G+C Gram-positive bacteria) TaxID=192944 RepID=UPI00163B37A9|nr:MULTISPECIES: aminotransferase class I/II-fold pyridoxal phosphate-dependent enzyme [unclassified Rhodococcus (in: high G+C Gram-positive bacteria)]MBC2638705.1 aminotransferase class I/II-fold pyridoxal phosphate-dependent enzyme [Rhodococcus sp. 3A]MBC2896554.1 aminotransferase class I/II-fold pyridoxal phosphate-dependent enzyme [Rhodococcus sp. 4CII]
MTAPTLAGPGVRFDLALSENPFAPLPSVLAALDDVMRRAHRYPEFLPDRLVEIIANHEALEQDQVMVGAGATGVALQIMHSVAEPGERIVYTAPTFDGYPIMADIASLDAVPVPILPDGGQDLAAMAAAIDDRTRLVVVCRPHNPTGTLVDAAELRAFLRCVPERVIVILDEAYVEFVDRGLILDVHRIIAEHPNVVFLRTFSKAYGLAGLRIGFGFANAALAQTIRQRQLPFGMGSAAVPAVAASYAAEDELRARVSAIVVEREELWRIVRAAGVPAPRSHANFLYLPGSGVGDALARAGIHARTYPHGDARIAVGDPDAGRAVADALRPTVRGPAATPPGCASTGRG